MKVQCAYLGSQRVLVDDKHRVYNTQSGSWNYESKDTVHRTGMEYATWSDVPAVWIGGCPFWMPFWK